MVRYRGSLYQNGSGFFPQILKNLFSKIANFSRPILRAAAPHAKAAMLAAQPHLREAASGIVKNTTDHISNAITRKLAPQEGSGRKRKRKATREKPPKKGRKTRRIPPLDIPDFY